MQRGRGRQSTLDDITNGQILALVIHIMDELEHYEPYLYHVSQHDSVYIKFGVSERIKSIRIADHAGRKKYKYKWNVAIDGKTGVRRDGRVIRFFFNHNDVQSLIRGIEDKVLYEDIAR